MKTILDLSAYFDLFHYYIHIPEDAETVPCQLLLGEGRSLEVPMAPEGSRFSALGERSGRRTWSRMLPLYPDRRGDPLRFDAAKALAQLGYDAAPCSDALWQSLRDHTSPIHLVADGPMGLVESRQFLYNKDIWQNTLSFRQGGLRLYDQTVLDLHWWTHESSDCPQFNAGLLSRLRPLLDKHHILGKPGLLRLMEGISAHSVSMNTPDMNLTWVEGALPRFVIIQRPHDLTWVLPPMDREGCLELMAQLVGLGSRITAVDLLTQLAGRPSRG